LASLSFRNNAVVDLQKLTSAISFLYPHLQALDLRGNPIIPKKRGQVQHYRDYITQRVREIKNIDGVAVGDDDRSNALNSEPLQPPCVYPAAT
jgi:hypothetical protein